MGPQVSDVVKPEVLYFVDMALSKSFTNWGQDFFSALVLFPSGHHSTLPRPITKFPNRLLPLRTWTLSALAEPRFVSSTDEACSTITVVVLRRCALGIVDPRLYLRKAPTGPKRYYIKTLLFVVFLASGMTPKSGNRRPIGILGTALLD
jgi:hypothetical protein